MSLFIVYTELKETCQACPEQWSAKINDEIELYVRYRHGHMQCELHSTMRNYSAKTLDTFVQIKNLLIDVNDPPLGVSKMVQILTTMGIMADPHCEYTDYDRNTYDLHEYIQTHEF